MPLSTRIDNIGISRLPKFVQFGIFIPGLVAPLLDPFGGRRIVRSYLILLVFQQFGKILRGENPCGIYPCWTQADPMIRSVHFPRFSVRSGCFSPGLWASPFDSLREEEIRSFFLEFASDFLFGWDFIPCQFDISV